MAGQWNGKSRGGSTGYRIFIFLIRHCGVRAAYVLLSVVAIYFIPAAPRSTGDIWRYARRILGYSMLRSAWTVYLNYFAFGQSIIDKVAISSGLSGRFRYKFGGFGRLEDAIRDGRGAIIISAHFGNWAAGEPFFRKYGARLNLVMYDNEHAAIKQVLEKNSSGETPFSIIPVNRDSLGHVFMITEALDRGELVCLLGDRYVHEDNLLSGKFVGRTVKFPSGPFVLASRMKVPVLFYFSVRETGMTYRFTFSEAEVPAGRGNSTQAVLDQFIAVLEKELKAHPEQWYNYYDFWGLRKRGKTSVKK